MNDYAQMRRSHHHDMMRLEKLLNLINVCFMTVYIEWFMEMFKDCVQCADQKPQTLFVRLSCGHEDVCSGCIVNNYRRRNRKCPVCRARICTDQIRLVRLIGARKWNTDHNNTCYTLITDNCVPMYRNSPWNGNNCSSINLLINCEWWDPNGSPKPHSFSTTLYLSPGLIVCNTLM